MGVRGKARKAGQAQSVTNMPRSLDLALWVVVEPQKGSVQRRPQGQIVLLKVLEAALKDMGRGRQG